MLFQIFSLHTFSITFFNSVFLISLYQFTSYLLDFYFFAEFTFGNRTTFVAIVSFWFSKKEKIIITSWYDFFIFSFLRINFRCGILCRLVHPTPVGCFRRFWGVRERVCDHSYILSSGPQPGDTGVRFYGLQAREDAFVGPHACGIEDSIFWNRFLPLVTYAQYVKWFFVEATFDKFDSQFPFLLEYNISHQSSQ